MLFILTSVLSIRRTWNKMYGLKQMNIEIFLYHEIMNPTSLQMHHLKKTLYGKKTLNLLLAKISTCMMWQIIYCDCIHHKDLVLIIKKTMSQCAACTRVWLQFLDIVYGFVPKNLDCKIMLGTKPCHFVTLPITTTDHRYDWEHNYSECMHVYLFTCKQRIYIFNKGTKPFQFH